MGDHIIRIDSVLGRIAKGNDYETAKDFWQAAHCFGDAMGLLFQLAIEMTPHDEEEERILELYQAQCREYLHRGRQMLIEALRNEDASDTSDKDGDPIFITLSDDEAKQRVQLFSTLFSKELEMGAEDIMLPDASNLSEQQLSLEARLQSLNNSLKEVPSLRTDEEHLGEIIKSLKGLGVNVHSHADQPRPTIEVPVSTEDQVANIIAQAKDEVKFGTLTEKNCGYDDVSLTDDDDEVDDEEEIKAELNDDIPTLANRTIIRKRVINAQVKLAQLLALLDTTTNTQTNPVAKQTTAKRPNEDSEERNTSDADNEDSDDEKRDAFAEKIELDLDQARTLLLKAEKSLAKAAEAWMVT